MYKDKRILVVVPARGGSKGLPLKNLRRLQGASLVGQVGRCAARVTEVDRAVVSTDHNEIVEEAKANGLDAPFLRPVSLSGDRIGDLDVLTHALTQMERIDGQIYDVVVMLQPTAPQRTAEHVSATIRKLVDEGQDTVWTISATDLKHHPLKQLTLNEETGQMQYYDPEGASIIARQQLKPIYHRNGIAYAFSRDCLLEQKVIMGERSAALVLDGTFISIDTQEDMDRVETLMAKINNGETS